MNKLEEYREKFSQEKAQSGTPFSTEISKRRYFVQEGFDAAIALDLPIKFAEWKNTLKWEKEGFHYLDLPEGIILNEVSDLYKYWIDNIYKPEV